MSTVVAVIVLLAPVASGVFAGWLWGYDRGEAKGFWQGLEAGRREAKHLSDRGIEKQLPADAIGPDADR